MTFQLSIEGGSEMNYKVVEKEAFRIAGLKKRIPIIFEGINPEIASMWKDVKEISNELERLSNVEPLGIIQASINFDEGRMEEKGKLDHYIGVATTKECPNNMEQLEVPASTWAVFESIGSFPETLQNIWGRIYSEWFPSSSYELSDGPEVLWNENNDFDSSNFKSEIWIPIKRR